MALFNRPPPVHGAPRVLLAPHTELLSGATINPGEKLIAQQILQDGYQEAKAHGRYTLEPALSFQGVVASNGTLNATFLLPNGEQIGKRTSIGLPSSSEDQKLHEIRYSKEERGYWLSLSARNKSGERIYSSVLISENHRGKEAVLEYKAISQAQKELLDNYRTAREGDSIDFGVEGRPSSDLIDAQGGLQMSLLLPNGEQIGKSARIGLPSPSKDQKLHEIRYGEEERGYWLTFSARNKNGERIYSSVLISENRSGKEAVIQYKAISEAQKEFLDNYRGAREGDSIDFGGEGRPSADLIGTQGTLQTTFLLPNGEQIGKATSIGLPSPSKDQKLHEIRYGEEERGYWLTFSARNKNGERIYSSVLISENRSGKEAVIQYKAISEAQKEFLDNYRGAREGDSIDFGGEGRPSADLIGTNGVLQYTFLLPNGEQLGKPTSIGLPSPSEDQKLHEIRYSKEERGYWLSFSARNEKGERIYSSVLISETLSGKEAIIQYKAISQAQKEFLDNYRGAREGDSIDFGVEGRPSADLIGAHGVLKQTFRLPNGEQIGKSTSIGLPQPSKDQKLHAIEYSTEEEGFWLTFSALNKHNVLCFSKVLVSETLSGRDALVKVETDREDNTIPEVFKRSAPALPPQFSRAHAFAEKELSSDLKRRALSPTFPKGEAFEQIAGVLLASLYPDESLTPQYCLKVNSFEGYFGVRVDYKVGQRIFEIKWGGAEENIHDTYQKHQPYLDKDTTYTVITLIENGNITIPHKTFAQLSQASPLRDDLVKIVEILEGFVAESDVEGINLVRDYLYSALKDEREKGGSDTIEVLRRTLNALTQAPPERRKAVMRDNAKFHFQTLEAYFEFEGRTYRSFISPKALYEESPEAYSIIYRFGDLEFEHELDRDVAVMLDLALLPGELDATGVEKTLPASKIPYAAPIFALPNGKRFSTHLVNGAVRIHDLSDLQSLVHFEDGSYQFGLEWIAYFGNRA